MVDIDANGGLQVIVKELLEAGLLDGEALPAPARRSPSRFAGSIRRHRTRDVIHSVAKPYKATGGLRLLHGNLAPTAARC